MSELRSIGWYASRISPNLPSKVFKQAPERLWGGLVYLALTLSGMIAISTVVMPWYAKLGISILVGCGFSGLGFLGHEILHGTVVKNAALRDFLGQICFFQFNLGPKLWRKWHNMEHHAHTQHDDLDPDAWASVDDLFERPKLKALYKIHHKVRALFTFVAYTFFFSVHSVLILRKFYNDFKPQERRTVAFQFFFPAIAWFALLPLIGPVNWLFVYVLPLMIANFFVISYISTNHQLNPMTEVNDPLANSLSVTVPRWVDVLHFNFSYHTEHHVFPGVNPKWGPLIKAELLKMWPELYHEMPMTKAMAALWKTPRIYKDQTLLVDVVSGIAYPTLGHGLKGDDVKPLPGRISDAVKGSFSTMVSNPGQQGD